MPRMGTSKDNDGRDPMHPIRIPDDLWKAAQEKARLNDESVARVVRRALRQYVDGDWE